MRYLLVLFLAACTTDAAFGFSNVTDYPVNPTVETPRGFQVDTSGQTVDLNRLDALVAEFEACSGKSVDSLTVKIAPDYYISECSGSQLFPCDIPESVCGGTPIPECPCACAGTVQGTVIVVPPSLAALKHELHHLVLGKVEHEAGGYECE